jgi:hypothetical protein
MSALKWLLAALTASAMLPSHVETAPPANLSSAASRDAFGAVPPKVQILYPRGERPSTAEVNAPLAPLDYSDASQASHSAATPGTLAALVFPLGLGLLLWQGGDTRCIVRL